MQLGRPTRSIEINENLTLLELKQSLSEEIELPIHCFSYTFVKPPDNTIIKRVLLDSEGLDQEVDSLFTDNPPPENIRLIINQLLGPDGYTKTSDNPRGYSLGVNLTDNPNRFFRKIDECSHSFRRQVERLGITDVPEDFLDPVTGLCMSNPYISQKDGKTYDYTTLDERTELSGCRPNLRLYSVIRNFIKDHPNNPRNHGGERRASAPRLR